MNSTSTPTSRAPLRIALSLSLLSATACGGSNASPGNTGSTGNGGSAAIPTGPSSGGYDQSGPGTGGTSTTGGTSNAGSTNSTSSTGGSISGGTGGTGTVPPSAGGASSACEAGSGVQGGGSDTCENLAWRCVDETKGNPPVHLVGAECSTQHTGACCNYSDKCLTNANGTPSSQSAVEVAIGPCQAGCATNPSAQACLDCINGNLASAGVPKLSDGCGSCFTSLIACSFASCLTQCLVSSTSPACRECVFGNCTIGAGKFNDCSGTFNSAGL